MTQVLQHKHLILKAKYGKPIKTEEKAKKFLTDLISIINMKVATPAQASYITDPGNIGVTGSIGLVTSHAAFHVFEDLGEMHFDLYSCKCFDAEKVIDYIADTFHELVDLHIILLDRETMKIETLTKHEWVGVL